MKTSSENVSGVQLSLVIPTLDRPKLLAETLSTIAPQLCSTVELVVLDGSTDSQPVREMVEKAGGRYSWQKPAGFDQAYLDVVELAKGEYIWLFGDDDLMKPKAIENVLKILKDSGSLAQPVTGAIGPPNAGGTVPLDLLIVNADVIASEPSTRILKERCLDMPETEYGLSDRSEVVAKLGGLISFMGSIVIRKEFWSQGAAAASEHVGKRLITMIIPLILPAKRVRFIPSVLVSARYGHQSWMESASTLIGRTMADVIWSFQGVEDYAKQACVPRPPSCHMLLLWRALGQPVGTMPYIKARLIGLMPASLTKWLCRLWLRLIGKTNTMTGYTLGF